MAMPTNASGHIHLMPPQSRLGSNLRSEDNRAFAGSSLHEYKQSLSLSPTSLLSTVARYCDGLMLIEL